jgi:hypothetical protein
MRVKLFAVPGVVGSGYRGSSRFATGSMWLGSMVFAGKGSWVNLPPGSDSVVPGS